MILVASDMWRDMVKLSVSGSCPQQVLSPRRRGHSGWGGEPGTETAAVSVLRGMVAGDASEPQISGQSPGLGGCYLPKGERGRAILIDIKGTDTALPLQACRWVAPALTFMSLASTTSVHHPAGCPVGDGPPPSASHRGSINCLYCSLLIGNNRRAEVSFNQPLSAPEAVRDWWIQ